MMVWPSLTYGEINSATNSCCKVVVITIMRSANCIASFTFLVIKAGFTKNERPLPWMVSSFTLNPFSYGMISKKRPLVFEVFNKATSWPFSYNLAAWIRPELPQPMMVNFMVILLCVIILFFHDKRPKNYIFVPNQCFSTFPHYTAPPSKSH